MKAVTIHDHANGSLSFDLIDLLEFLGLAATLSVWECHGVDALGQGAEALHSASDSDDRIAGEDLVAAAKATQQVIDGHFEAWRPGEGRPWLAIRAVDSSLYVVVTSDEDVLRRIREKFKDVRDSSDDAAYFG